MAGRIPLLGALLLVACNALAALPDEIQVYTDDINAPGEWSLELHLNATPTGRRTPEFPGEVMTRHGLRVTPEISRGLTKTVDVGLYLPYARDAGGRVLFGGPKARLKWLPLQPGERGGVFAGANLEYSWLNRNFETGTRSFELRPILGWKNERWLLATNPVLDWALNGPDRGGRPFFNPSFKVARTVTKDLALGFEYYTGLGRLARPLPPGERAKTLYFAAEWEGGPVPLHFGIGRGLNDATDRWTVKAILEFSFR